MGFLSALDRKLVRDLYRVKGQALAICLVIAGGIAAFVFSASLLESLTQTRSSYYEQYRFGDIFASLERAPETVAREIAALPGVAALQTRVVRDVTLDLPELIDPATGRLLGLPPGGDARVNRVFLRQGRFPQPTHADEVIASEAFAEAHELAPGDSLVAIINGRRRTLEVVGIGLSPEYIYSIRPGDLFPDNLRFGVLWMNERHLAAAFDMEGGFNDVSIRLAPGASADAVVERIDDILHDYGGLGATERELQVSHWYLAGELRQLRTMGRFIPTIFLAVAAFLLNVVLLRIISLERDQIAILKAFGYSDRHIGWHYAKLTLVIVAVGWLLGILGGRWLGIQMTEMYAEFFRFPILQHELSLRVMILALGVGLVGGGLGAWSAIRRATSMPPAEAMRPEPPARFSPTILERLGMGNMISEPTRMVLRYLERHPFKTGMSVLGIAMGVAILILGTFLLDGVDFIMDLQFGVAQREDATISLVQASSAKAEYELARLPGVYRLEPFRSVSVRLRHGHRHRRVAVQGIRSGNDLHRVIEAGPTAIELPPDGLVLSEKLGRVLGVQPGDRVRFEVLEGAQPTYEVVVSRFVRDYFGMNAYMDLRALNRLMQEGGVISGAFVAVVNDREEDLYQETKQVPRVAAVTITTAALAAFRKTLNENLVPMTIINVLFASVIAFGVVYNSARIALSERSRELATLRVLGFTRAEISFILLAELAVVTLLAIPLGCLIGYGLAALLTLGFDTEVYRIPLFIAFRTYAFASAVVLLATVFSGLVVRRSLDQLDLVAVLKTRE